MVTRFEKAEQVALNIIDETMNYFADRIDVSCFKKYGEESVAFFVANPAGYQKKGVIEAIIPAKKFYFNDCGVWESIRMSREVVLPNYKIIDSEGNILKGKVTVLPHGFDYDLPKDKFRQPFMVRSVKVVFEVEEIPAFSVAAFALVDEKVLQIEEKETKALLKQDGTIENEFIHVKVEENGSLTITEKKSGRVYQELGILEDCGDVGNEYI